MISRRARDTISGPYRGFEDGEFNSAIFNTAWGHLKGQRSYLKVNGLILVIFARLFCLTNKR